MKGMTLHCGGRSVGLEELKGFGIPEKTATYTPIGHYDLCMDMAHVGKELLTPKGWGLVKEQYAVVRNGERFFGYHGYLRENGETEMGLAVAFRNSYDKSMSVGIAFGSRVFICDNLALTGEMVTMRKHTVNLLEDLKMAMLKKFFEISGGFEYLQKFRDTMKTVEISEVEGYRMLGELMGKEVLGVQMGNTAMREWKKPSFEQFTGRNAWSLYNTCTYALKAASPDTIIERHLVLTEGFKERWGS